MSLAMTETLKCLKHFSAQCMKKMAQTPKTSSLFLIPSISLGKRSWGKEKLGGKRSYVSLGCILAKALLSGFIWFRACFCLLK